MLPAAADRSAPRSRWTRWRPALALLAYAAILTLALRTLDLTRLAEAFARLRPHHVSLLIGLAVLHVSIRVLRYHALVRRASPSPYRFVDGAHIFLIGLSASIVTPGRAGDLIKAELTRAHGIRRATGLGIVAIERILDLLMIAATIVVTGALLSYRAELPSVRLAGMLLFLGLSAGTAVVTVKRWRRWAIEVFARLATALTRRLRSERVVDVLQNLFNVWDEIFSSPISVFKYVAVTAAAWLVDFLKLWVVLRCIGLEVPLLPVLFVYPVSLVAGILTLLPFSEGVVGVTTVALLGQLAQVDAESATAAVLVDRGISSMVPLALFALLRIGWSRSSERVETSAPS